MNKNLLATLLLKSPSLSTPRRIRPVLETAGGSKPTHAPYAKSA